MMRKSIALFAGAVVMALPMAAELGPALAQLSANPPRADALRLSCSEARRLVARSGGAVLYQGPNIYDLYHPDGRACYSLQQDTQRAYIRTRDTPQCFVGYTCVRPERLFDWWR